MKRSNRKTAALAFIALGLATAMAPSIAAADSFSAPQGAIVQTADYSGAYAPVVEAGFFKKKLFLKKKYGKHHTKKKFFHKKYHAHDPYYAPKKKIIKKGHAGHFFGPLVVVK